MQAHIFEIVVVDGDQRLADGIEETIGANEARFRMRQCLCDQMLGELKTARRHPKPIADVSPKEFFQRMGADDWDLLTRAVVRERPV